MFRDPAPLLRARTVAIVGASERARWPVQIHANLTGAGAAARIIPVNPGRDEVWGLKCYPDLASLPEAPDTALMIVPAAHIVPALAQGAKHGLKSALIYASEMGEGSAPESIARGRALATLCEDTGLVVCGPNCMGSSSVREKLFFYPPIGHEEVAPGPVGVIFHSGGSLQYIARAGAARGLGFSYMISSGNEISLDAADYINFLVEDEHTRIIAMFIEGIRRPEAFMEAARRALAAGKPILAVKAGRTDEARRAALSHTGAIAGDYEVFAALCERYGIVLCAALDDLVETALAFQARTLPRGERIAVIANSGGVVDLLYDHAADEGIRLAKLSAKTARSLRPLVGPAMEIRNPMDCGAAGFADMENYARVGETVVADDGVDLLLFENRAPDRRGNRPPEPFRRLAENAGKPVLAFTRMRHPLTDAGRAFQESVGIPFLQSMPETLRAARALVFYGKRQGRRIPVLPAARGRRSTATGDGLARALRAHGLPAPRSAFALSAAEAARAAAKIGFPVALKIVSAAISHKTEAGGVVLNVGSAAAVKREAEALAKRARRAVPGSAIDGYLVQEMVSGTEVILGCKDDPLYGPVMIVGAGGILVELTEDVSFRMLPVRKADARAMLAELKVSRLLSGFRGRPAMDADALIEAMCGLSAYFLDHRPYLAEIEINPLIVCENGRGVQAVDIRPVPREGPSA